MPKMSHRENMLRTIFFQHPEYIPVSYCINPSYYFAEDADAILDMQARHPSLFPGFVRPKDTKRFLEDLRNHLGGCAKAGQPFVDDFGCTWVKEFEGMVGTVTGHPLDQPEKFKNYKFPDPERCTGIGPVDWEQARIDMAAAKAAGHFTVGGLRHGHTFLQLTDLCGYENFLFYMADEEPMLEPLIQGITDFNCAIIQKYLDMDVDMIIIPEDLGMQHGPMITPENFRRYIKPSYKRMMRMVRQAGKIVHMHSDGDIRDLVDDIIGDGCQVINLQDLVNGIDWIAEHFRGKVCVELDIDRQSVTFGGTPKDIDDLIREEVTKIATPAGGMMMVYGLYPGTPIENAEAVATAMEKYSRLTD